MGKIVTVQAPASVSNLNCGFDVLGMALEEPYDRVTVEMTSTGIIEITDIKGCNGLSLDPAENVAGAVLAAFKNQLPADTGYRVSIEKGITPGSGIGSSAASSAATAVAANVLLGEPYSREQVVSFAMEGEKLASGAAHADNAAPSVLGGITLIRGYDPLDIVSIEIPPELYCVIIHPDVEVKTSMARGILDEYVPLKTAVRQWGNLGGLVAGLYSCDYDLIGRSLHDHIVEPKRKSFIPAFDEMKLTAMDSGALGAGISGSGPSFFALCRGAERADEVRKALAAVMSSTGTGFRSYLSHVSGTGARVVS